jgi:flagellar biosynthesis chaperone FliJ
MAPVAHDTLSVLIRLRQQACDDAQRQLVASLAAEGRAQAMADDAERAIASETEAALDLCGSDATVEAFAAWLPVARGRLEQALRGLETRRAETARARAGLAASRTALESVETLQQRRQEKERLARERRWQLELEDRPAPVEQWPESSQDDAP